MKTAKQYPPILDACCGSRMFWFNRENKDAFYMDKREEQHILCDGRVLKIAPDIVADFTKMPFPDETFWLVVFDPPHMDSLGEQSWLVAICRIHKEQLPIGNGG